MVKLHSGVRCVQIPHAGAIREGQNKVRVNITFPGSTYHVLYPSQRKTAHVQQTERHEHWVCGMVLHYICDHESRNLKLISTNAWTISSGKWFKLNSFVNDILHWSTALMSLWLFGPPPVLQKWKDCMERRIAVQTNRSQSQPGNRGALGLSAVWACTSRCRCAWVCSVWLPEAYLDHFPPRHMDRSVGFTFWWMSGAGYADFSDFTPLFFFSFWLLLRHARPTRQPKIPTTDATGRPESVDSEAFLCSHRTKRSRTHWLCKTREGT